MDALTVLQQRVSSAILNDPAPTQEQLNEMFKAALRAPDHGALTPWRFLTIQGDARQKFCDALYRIRDEEGVTGRGLNKMKTIGLRAPMIIVAIASLKESEKIPDVEQDWSAVAATQNLILAAEALGLGAIWRSGWPTFHDQVNAFLGLSENEKVVGYVYVGQRPEERRPIAPLAINDYVSEWNG
jgi:nitroreductase